MDDSEQIVSTAKLLGYAGLLPFAALTGLVVWAWVSEQRFAWTYGFAALAYGAVILSFVGALHWAYALRAPELGSRALVWSVVPSLVGWAAICFAAFAGGGYGVFAASAIAMIAVFVLHLKEDRSLAVRAPSAAPSAWFMRLRVQLTLGACVSLAIVAAAALAIR
jgi:hypothetical protein